MKQTEQAKTFATLHKKGSPVILFNVWDAGSASIVEKAGAKAIATGSWPVAVAHGYADGEAIPLDLVLANAARIVGAVDVPVSIDLEGGYGTAPDVVAETVSRAVSTGIVGFNFEDQVVGGEELHSIENQVCRVEAARSAADKVCPGVFINARTDMFLKAKPDTHNDEMLDAALERASAYAAAGASGSFAPGLADEGLIKRLCDEAPLPVNIIALPHVPDTAALTKLGVARISYGPVPYKRMAVWLEGEARRALSSIQ